MQAQRIDVHHHVLPPFWVEGLKLTGSPHRPPAWSPDGALAFMDSRRIGKAMLSLTAPGITAWRDRERCEMARRVNDYTAELGARAPDRFGNFITLPLPDIEAALRELEHGFDTLKADGVVLLSNYGEAFLGDPMFEPLWQELHSRGAIVFIHPTRTSLPELAGIPAPFVDFPFATTRTAVDMVLKGVLDRYPNMRIILSHAGGFLPFAAHRFATCAETMPAYSDAETITAGFRRFYFDTALSSSTSAILGLKAFADPSRILFGSDYPYAPGQEAECYTAQLDANKDLSPHDHAAIDYLNAERLFGTATNGSNSNSRSIEPADEDRLKF